MPDSSLTNKAASWAHMPASRQELYRRQEDPPKPACRSVSKGSYDMTAHVLALVLILVLSTLACGLPLISRRASKNSGPNTFVFLSQHFGTGVLIATAFVHLLPTAFVSLLDPCLPWFWNKGYRPMAGVVAMASALVVVGVEMFLRARGAAAGHSHESWGSPMEGNIQQLNGAAHSHNLSQQNNTLSQQQRLKRCPTELSLEDLEASEGLVGASPLIELGPQKSGLRGTSGENDDRDSSLDLAELDSPIELEADNAVIETTRQCAEEEQRKRLIQCLLLEAGILFHSVFIGMAVSVATGPPFVIFLIAIAFHQSFEGVALGSRIAAINFPKSSLQPWLMVLAYGTTTPIGQAMGLLVHQMYDPHSETGLLMVGIMNAISSGLLLFAGLVQLLAEDFLSDKSYDILRGRKRVHAFIAVIAGAALMAMVGAWA